MLQSQIKAGKMMMIETAGYDPIYLRPYTTNYNHHVQEMLHTSTEGGQNMSTSALSSAATDFLRPSAGAGCVAHLVNGFNEKRFSFMLEVHVGDGGAFSNVSRYVLTGYTDYLGVSTLTGQPTIDPNMKLFFNNIFSIRDTTCQGPHGPYTISNLVNAQHILFDIGSTDYDQYQGSLWSMSPGDVAGTLENLDVSAVGGLVDQGAYDARPLINNIKGVSRGWDSRPEYLSKTIRAYQKAHYEEESYDESNSGEVWRSTRGQLKDSTVTSNPLTYALIANSNYMNTGYVTYSELVNVVEGVREVNDVIMANHKMKAQYYQPGQGENWNGATPEHIAATVIQQSVPAIMSNSLLTRIAFRATNDTIGGENVVTIGVARSFVEGVDQTQQVNYFIERLKQEVLYDISRGGGLSYQIDVDLNLLFDSHLHISIDGEPFVYFAAPTFCDALFSPIVTNQPDHLQSMSGDVSTMLYSITGELSSMGGPSVNQHQPIQTPSGQPVTASNFTL